MMNSVDKKLVPQVKEMNEIYLWKCMTKMDNEKTTKFS